MFSCSESLGIMKNLAVNNSRW